MKTKNNGIDIKSLLLGALASACVILSAAAATNSGSRTNWEYAVIQGTVFGHDVSLGEAINRHAAQGWDFVSASPSKDLYGFAVMRREMK